MSEHKHNNVEAALRAIVIKNSRLPIKTVDDEAFLVADLGFDSLAFLMTLSDLEDKFRIVLPVEKVDEFKDLSFRELVSLVAKELPRAKQQC